MNEPLLNEIDTQSEPIDSGSEAGYPSVTIEPDLGAYPGPGNLETERPYPAPIVFDESKRFTINEPLRVGDTVVSGTGPANVPIKIVNVSYLGESLGLGTIDADGTFQIQISPPLEARHMIGVQLSNPSLEPDFYDAPDIQNFPMIGLLMDTTVVQE